MSTTSTLLEVALVPVGFLIVFLLPPAIIKPLLTPRNKKSATNSEDANETEPLLPQNNNNNSNNTDHVKPIDKHDLANWTVDPDRQFDNNTPPQWMDRPGMHLLMQVVAILIGATLIFAFYSGVPTKLQPPTVVDEFQKRNQRKVLSHLTIYFTLTSIIWTILLATHEPVDQLSRAHLMLFVAIIGMSIATALTSFVIYTAIPLTYLHRKRVDGLIPSPENDSSIYSYLTFAWFDPIMLYGYINSIELPDLFNVNKSEQIYNILQKYNTLQSKNTTTTSTTSTKNNNIPLIKSILILNGRAMLIQFLFVLLSTAFFFSSPYFLNRIIYCLENPDLVSKYAVYGYVFAILIASLGRFVLDGQNSLRSRKIGMRVTNLLCGLIYQKGLRRMGKVDVAKGDDKGKGGKKEEGGASVGKIANLMSNIGKPTLTENFFKSITHKDDAEEAAFFTQSWYSPLIIAIQIIVCIASLIFLLGWTAIIGIGVLLALIFSGGPLANLVKNQFAALKKANDKRTEATNELLQGIRIVKLFAWETQFEKRVTDLRNEEIRVNFWTSFSTSCTRVLWISAPTITTFVTFAAYAKLSGKELDAATAFTSLSLFNMVKGPLQAFPDMIVFLLDSFTSFSRISNFLSEEELEDFSNPSKNTAYNKDKVTLGFHNAGFEWRDLEEPTKKPEPKKKTSLKSLLLSPFTKKSGYKPIESTTTATTSETTESENIFRLLDLDLEFPTGELSVIIGATGSGKSSLLLALLGEMRRFTGSRSCPISKSQSIAYVTQSAWLTNNTIRDNILFGLPYDPVRYQRVIKGCALEKDLEILEGGDMTEIGFKGINLSGGQKQRIALARAAYSDAKIVVLDDPLSAVDAPTARHLFEHCIVGLLANRTRILVTNAVGLAIPRADFLVMIQSGRIATKGSVEFVFNELKHYQVVGPYAESISEMSELVLSERRKYFDKFGKPVSAAASEVLDDVIVSGASADEMNESGRIVSSDSVITDAEKALKEKSKLVEKEKMEKGNVKGEIYKFYFSSLGGFFYISLLILGYSLNQGFGILQDLVIRWWTAEKEFRKGDWFMGTLNSLAGKAGSSFDWTSSSYYVSSSLAQTSDSSYTMLPFSSTRTNNFTISAAEPSKGSNNSDYYLILYAVFGFCFVLSVILRLLLLVSLRLLASKKIHEQMLHRVLRAPMRFFEVTPIGRIMNRFTNDISSVDRRVSIAAGNSLYNLTLITFVLGTISMFLPALIVIIIPIGYIYIQIGLYYIRTSQSLKRISAVTKTPILSLFFETLNGVSVIRSFKHIDRFEKEFSRRVDDNNRSSYFLFIASAWLSLRIQAVGASVMFVCGLLVVISGVGPSLAGLCLNLTFTLSSEMINLVRNQSEFELAMNAVERCYEYLEIEQEADAIIETNRPAENWPSEGKVSIQSLEMRYSPETPVVLHGISAEIGAREKVGIVGRTGAGKSTMTLAFFRVIEPSGGTIVIDGVDIRQIGLDDLRSHLTIIPQDPILFAGTVRYNMDPFEIVPDADLWAALKRAHLVTPSAIERASSSASISSASSSGQSTPTLSEEVTLAGGNGNGNGKGKEKENECVITLDTQIAEGGSNLSAGQRQLLCLARALARKSRVIMLDEATASVDTETDSRIQDTIRTELTHCTVLTIAHRLKTVVDYDRIIVLDQGKIIENGSPLELIENSPVKAFRKMCEESGEFDELLALAKRK
ncbi:hypothetical protein HDU76_002250 [Blyttiomyces sp. JEL0837]|nr:hypothetical protein HDU76_002250 [Blyttiomyces sp. JEL0837]